LLADKSKLLPLIAEFQTLHDFKEIVPISALKKKGLDELLPCVLKALPNGPRYFPEDQITDQPVRFMAAETIREHVLMQTHEEVPHAVSVLVEQFEESPRMTRIAAVIFASATGKGDPARQRRPDAEENWHRRPARHREDGWTRVFLELFVKIKAGWRDSRTFVEELDWRRQLQQIAGCRSRSREAASGSPFRGDAASAVVAGVYGDLPRHSKYSCIWSRES